MLPVEEYPGEFDTDHTLLKFSAYFDNRAKQRRSKTVFNFRKGDYERLRHMLGRWNLCNVINESSSVDSAWEQWSSSVNSAIVQCVPLVRIKDYTAPPWIDAEARHLQNKKLTAWRKAKKSGCEKAWSKFRCIRNQAKKLFSDKYRNFMNGLSECIAGNAKKFWSFFRSKSKSKSIPCRVVYKDQQAEDSKDKAELFNKYFHSTFNSDAFTTLPEIEIDRSCIHELNNVTFHSNMLEHALLQLDVSKASGPDDISAIVLKECAHILAPSLALLFNYSMRRGQLPKQWKTANVVPVHKKSSKRNVTHYRPVSLLCTVSKVMERCIFDYVFPILRPLISEHQHGFVRGRSPATQLTQTYHTVGAVLDNTGQTDLLFLDLSKAFDSVSHSLLLHKLTSFGINGALLKWLENYLSDRRQRVLIEGVCSEFLPVISGVPQGSILGPLLFTLYINDLPGCSVSQVDLFADDAKCHRRITSLDDCYALQRDLDSLATWCTKWKLSFNTQKCKVMSVSRCRSKHVFKYTLNGVVLERVDQFTDLGVVISSDLSYQKHIKGKVNKANSMVGLIKRTTGKLAAPNVMSKLFETLVRSHLEYCSPVWSPRNKRDIVLIERVQRGFTKCILKNLELNYKERLLHLGLLPLSFRREMSDLLFLHKCIHGVYDVDFNKYVTASRNISLRSGSSGPLFRQLACNTSTFQGSFFPRVVTLWNTLPCDARECIDYLQFRKIIRTLYKSKLLLSFDPAVTCTWVSNCRCASCGF